MFGKMFAITGGAKANFSLASFVETFNRNVWQEEALVRVKALINNEQFMIKAFVIDTHKYNKLITVPYVYTNVLYLMVYNVFTFYLILFIISSHIILLLSY